MLGERERERDRREGSGGKRGGTHSLDDIVATCDIRGNYLLAVSFAIVIKIGAGAGTSAFNRCADFSWLQRGSGCELRFHCSANATKCLSRTNSRHAARLINFRLLPTSCAARPRSRFFHSIKGVSRNGDIKSLCAYLFYKLVCVSTTQYDE